MLQILEQSSKAAALATLCCAANLANMASVLIVSDDTGRAADLCSSIKSIVGSVNQLHFTGLRVQQMSDSAEGWEPLQMPRGRQFFEQGSMTLVVPATAATLQRLHIFLKQAQPTKLLLIADQADQLWTFHAASQQHPELLEISQPEIQMYHLLTISSLHAFVQVSHFLYLSRCGDTRHEMLP